MDIIKAVLIICVLILVVYLIIRISDYFQNKRVTGTTVRCEAVGCPCGGKKQVAVDTSAVPDVQCREDYINYITKTRQKFNAGIFNLLPSDESVFIAPCEIVIEFADGHKQKAVFGSSTSVQIKVSANYYSWVFTLADLYELQECGVVDVQFLGRVPR